MKNIHIIAFMTAMMAGMASTYGMPDMLYADDKTRRTISHEEAKKKYHPFRKQRDDETDEEYAAAWHEEYKHRLQADVAKKGLTVFEINGELIPAKNEREAQKRYKNRHK